MPEDHSHGDDLVELTTEYVGAAINEAIMTSTFPSAKVAVQPSTGTIYLDIGKASFRLKVTRDNA